MELLTNIVTKLILNIPINPQFNAPTIVRTRAIFLIIKGITVIQSIIIYKFDRLNTIITFFEF